MAQILVTETSPTLNNFHEHPLVRVEAAMNVHEQPYREFICDACNTPGSGSVDVRYRCNQCPLFDLHEVCATCPKNLSTHIHPIHQMVLVWRQPTPETNDLLLAAGCHVCGDEVKGLYYTCLQLEPPEKDNNSTSSCKGIVLHPICSKFPSHVQHVKDPHPLAFRKATASSCTICDEICDSWRYQCETCNTNIHPECVEPTVLVDESAKPSKQQLQPQRQQQPSGIPYCISVPFPMQQQQQQYHCHQEKRPAVDSGYPRPQPPQPPQQLVPMHQQWPPNNNYGAYHPPPPMHHPHHHHLQYFYPPYPYHLYNTYLQQTAAAYPYNTYLQQTAAAYPYYTYLQQTAAAAGRGASSSGGRKKKRRMFLVVGRVIATVALTTVSGIPHMPF